MSRISSRGGGDPSRTGRDPRVSPATPAVPVARARPGRLAILVKPGILLLLG